MPVSRSLSFHDQMRLTRIIHFSLLGAQIIFFIIAIIFRGSFMQLTETEILDYLVPIAVIGSIFLSRIVYRTLVNRGKNLGFIQKTDAYRNAVMVSLAMMEAGNFVAIISFMLTGVYLYAAASAVLFLLFILNAPSEQKFRTDLELTPDELRHTE